MTKNKRAAGLIYGSHIPYLDHLAPLCSLLEIPLIVTESAIASAAQKYYENLEVVLLDSLVLPEWVASHFELIFCCTPRDLFEEVFYLAQALLQKKIHTVWCPHGNSDKGANIFYMEALRKEKAALVYGKQMIEFFQRKGAWDSLQGHVITGNFRLEYFKNHRAFYEKILENEIKLKANTRTLLYAPTWKDYELSSSFFGAIEPLVERLPSEHQLIVKLHPNLLLQEEFETEEIVLKYQDRDNVLFLKDFPPIYPLLSLVDAYIGDMSSIGYDFLAFNKPLFFLNPNERDPAKDLGLFLFRCGIEIKPSEYKQIYSIIDKFFTFELRDFSSIRQEVYTYAFGHEKPLDVLKQEILNL